MGDEETTGMVMKLRPTIEAKHGKTFAKFEPRSYTSQVVAGTNFRFTIEVDGGALEVKVFKPLPCAEDTEPQVTNIQFVSEEPLGDERDGGLVGAAGSAQNVTEEVQALVSGLQSEIQMQAQAKGWNGIIDSMVAQTFSSQV